MKLLRIGLVLVSFTTAMFVIGPEAEADHIREGDVRIKVTCKYSHSLADDPIVFPDQPGAAHLHDFFGNTEADASTDTHAELQGAASTCNNPQDRAAYWAPAMYLNGVKQEPTRMTVYYRRANKAGTIETIPDGLRMIAGYQAGKPQPSPEIAGWLCSEEDRRQTLPPAGDCGVFNGTELFLKMVVTFPDCWNGRKLDSRDHRSHMAYSVYNPVSTHNECPSTHPVQLPQITEFVNYQSNHGGKTVTLASGAANTAHMDFINGWDTAELQTLVDDCLNGLVRCESGSGR